MSVIEDYEDKFQKLKGIMYHKEVNLSDLRPRKYYEGARAQSRIMDRPRCVPKCPVLNPTLTTVGTEIMPEMQDPRSRTVHTSTCIHGVRLYDSFPALAIASSRATSHFLW